MKSIIVMVLLSASALAQSDYSKPKFFTKSTTIELSFVAASISADGFTTPWNNRGEGNPIAKPFVRNTGLRAGYFGVSFASVILANKLLVNHPKIRHTINWSIVAWETKLSIGNVKYNSCVNSWIVKGIHCQ